MKVDVKNGEAIEYDLVKRNLIIPEQLIGILGEQNVEGLYWSGYG